jgi:hypothetical protein
LPVRASRDQRSSSCSTPTDDQIVTADIRPTTFYASGGWAGLRARHVNASAYYYAFLQRPGGVSLRRWMDGQVTILAEAPFTVRAGTSYRMRLEPIGSLCGCT